MFDLFWIKKLKEENLKILEENKKLSEAVTKMVLEPKVIIWIVNSHTKEDLDILKSNPEILKIIKKYFEYTIAKNTDLMRTSDNTQRVIWYVECLHAQHNFFTSLLKPTPEKEDYSWQNLK